MDRETYLEHRKSLVQLGVAQIASYDKTLLLLSTGALGASALFVDTFVGDGAMNSQSLLAASWALFTATMLANLLSYLSSWYDMDIERRELDSKYDAQDFTREHKNPARVATQWLNIAAFLTFSVAMILLLTFCFSNIH
ncbi:hypothetical protein VW23_000505 [Devosia insulae DS-56]|uniref:Uncharacterized protein n=1 Tax=Devosia insulae DS-56 TaxID=1116389 RepID=A0A1E5XHN9_9HYPH|nr:hypothetical protein [Devosia insulae]OEO28109.1 hypothetical protein VW23_000505 [Devosia insulae DS-56]